MSNQAINEPAGGSNGGNPQPGGQPQGQNTEPMFTQEQFQAEVDRRVTEALKTAQDKWNSELEVKLKNERDEATRLAKLSAEERAKEEFEKRVKDFEDREKKYNSERLEFECAKQLSREGLPPELSGILTGTTAEETKSNIDTFKVKYNEAVQKAVEEKIKGKTPSGGRNADEDLFLNQIKRGAGLEEKQKG